MTFTIFTPTYNRAYTLPRLYESLFAQKTDGFEWLVVDDGSTDNTETLIKTYQAENKFPIIYIKQENAGKHIAINEGLKYAQGDYFFILDSDDYLRPDSFPILLDLAQKTLKDFAGFTVIRFSGKIKFDPEKYGHKVWTEGAYHWEYPGEMSFVFKTEVAKAYPFPVFEGEKFCQESLILRRMLLKNKVLFTDHVVIGGDYLEDGLSANVWERMKKSPRYTMLNYSERIKQSQSPEHQTEYARLYWDIAINAKQIPWAQKLAGIPIGLTLQIFTNKLLRRSYISKQFL